VVSAILGKIQNLVDSVHQTLTLVIRHIKNEGVQTGIQDLPKLWTAEIKHNGGYNEALQMYFVK
jgi:hypothetical protein